MRFVAIALAILLAAGCQTHSIQADAPSQYEHIRSGVVTFMNQIKENSKQAIDKLDDGEFKDLKVQLHKGLDMVENMLTSASESLKPIRDGIGPTVVDTVHEVYDNVKKDVEELRTDLKPKCTELRTVIKKHLDQYREKLEPVITEYLEKKREQLKEFSEKMEPVAKEMKVLFVTNLEETKSKLTPIVETIRDKVTARVQVWQAVIKPYIDDYREQTGGFFKTLQEDFESGKLQEKFSKVASELKPQLEGVFNTIQKVFEKA
ncbi:apolipoprotein A-Ib [Electrophorus electricus]|uniref:Apolipoprotein A-I n=2 Tax=Electrophorus TaxID=8004 RepID=A0A4W4DZV7_ELEEL|nr:apolipoprotein A-Ib [Electrophorus electricus]XP_026886454.1 apolipoprotein A-Ib [Electrophorus electricus]